MAHENPNSFGARDTLEAAGKSYEIYKLDALQSQYDIARLPYSLKILLENLLRTEGNGAVGKDDITTALAKLNFGIDDVANQLKNLVTEHHHALLAQAAGIGDLEGSISSVRNGLQDVTASLEKYAS